MEGRLNKLDIPADPPSYEEAVKQANSEKKAPSNNGKFGEMPNTYVFKPHASRKHPSFPGNKTQTYNKQL